MVGMNDYTIHLYLHLFTDEEKKYVEDNAHVELSPTSDILQMDEAFVCYIAMTRSQQSVTFHIV